MSLIRLKYVFQEQDEAEEFYNKIYNKAKVKKIHVQLTSENFYVIQFEMSQNQLHRFWKDIVQALIHVFIFYRLPEIAKSILAKHYYYADKHEMDHIIPILQSIMKNPKHYGNQFEVQTTYTFYQMFERDVKKESFLNFNEYMSQHQEEYMSNLIDVTGYAIDEWKREEDYQEFIHSLRNFIKNKEPKMDTLLLMYDKELLFFKPNGRRVTYSEIKTIQHDERVHFIDVLSHDFPMSLIAAIAPREVVIYTNHISDPKIITLQNLFQEKAIIRPIDTFPFVGKKA